MLKFGAEYMKQSMADYEAKLRDKLARQLKAKAARLGFELVPRIAVAAS